MTIAFVILGILNILYGCSILMVGSGTGFFAVWIAIGLAFFAAAWGSHAKVWEKLPVSLQRVAAGMLCVLFALFVAVEGFALSGFSITPEDDLDYLIVLGAQVRTTGPSNVLQYRLDAAYDYAQDNPATMVIVSGGQGYNEPCPEAEIMARYLIERGLNEQRLIVENQALDTTDNIIYSMEFFDSSTARVGIVTNDFHLFRGMRIASKQGIVHVSGISAESVPYYLPNNLLREFFGICKDTLFGNM